MRKLSVIWLVITALFGTVANRAHAFPAAMDSLYTHYQRGLNTDDWYGGFSWMKNLSSLYRIRITENAFSSRLEVSPQNDKWKDRHQFMIQFSRVLSEHVDLEIAGNSFIYSDKQSGFFNDIKTHLISLGATYRTGKMRIPVMAGLKEDERYDQKDRGLNYRIGFELPLLELGEYRNQFLSSYEQDELERRKNSSLNVSYLVHRKFLEDTEDSLKLGINNLRRDYYISPEGDIESREEKGQRLENVLTYRLGSGLKCRIDGGLAYRNLQISLVEKDTRDIKRERRDFHAHGSLGLHWSTRSFRGYTSFQVINEDQTYELAETLPSSPFSGGSYLVTPDSKSSYTQLTLRTLWHIGAWDTLHFYSTLQRYRYDTPDDRNFDDRDELRFRFDTRYDHRFSSSLTCELGVSLNLIHFVYIYGQRSADNNWTRILRFYPVVTWRPSSRWKFTQTVEVLANYVAYDYESLFPNVKSYLYRKYRFDDSTRVTITSRLALNAFYRLEFDENGKFLWDQWTEQKLIDRESHTIALNLDYRVGRMHIGPGYSFYYRHGYRYSPGLTGEIEKEVHIRFKSHGPLFKVGIQTERLRFLFTGSTISTRTLESNRQILTRVNLQMSYYI